jgi:hypothetical protein
MHDTRTLIRATQGIFAAICELAPHDGEPAPEITVKLHTRTGTAAITVARQHTTQLGVTVYIDDRGAVRIAYRHHGRLICGSEIEIACEIYTEAAEAAGGHWGP